MNEMNNDELCPCCAKPYAAADQELVLHEGVSIETNLQSSQYDGVIFILYPKELCVEPPPVIANFISTIEALDDKLYKATTLWHCKDVCGSRLIISATGRITPYDDAKVIREAAINGMIRALEAGVKRPLFVVQNVPDFPEGQLVAILGALEALYVPIQAYERSGKLYIDKFGLHEDDTITEHFHNTVKTALALEKARIVTRDIAGGDPERMCPANIVTYLNENFANDTCVSIRVVDDVKKINQDYPLLSAVSRATNNIEKHKARIVELEYTPTEKNKVSDTIFLVGKGVCYDTGGADIKLEGNMRGMSRDKSGAACVAGFVKACSLLKPNHLKVHGTLCLCRNSVGSYSYVADELLVSRSGKTVRITNTDAEGRLAMADALTKAAELASDAVNPQVYTIATLTNHAKLCVGKYAVAIDNHRARSMNHANRLQNGAARISEGIEISVVRNEDFIVNEGVNMGEDLSQFNPDVLARKHQFAAGFLMKISGLDGMNVKYTHLDMLGTCGLPPEEPTAEPLLTLCYIHKVFTV